MAEAMRSMPEWAASDNMPSEPVRRPVTSLRRVMTAAAATEDSAARRLVAAAERGWAGGCAWAVVAMWRWYRKAGNRG